MSTLMYLHFKALDCDQTYSYPHAVSPVVYHQSTMTLNSEAHRVPIESKTVGTIDLILIDKQSVGKRSLNLVDTVNAKKRWTTIYWRVNKFLKESHVVTRLAKDRASVLKINDSNDISVLERLTVIIVVLWRKREY
jgi:hypothetical protein